MRRSYGSISSQESVTSRCRSSPPSTFKPSMQRNWWGLSATTVGCFHNVLHKALKTAVRWNLLSRNPCDLVSPPRGKRYEMQPLGTEQIQQFLAAARGHRMEALFIIMLVISTLQSWLPPARHRYT